MLLKQERIFSDDNATFSILFIDNTFECFVIEDEYREKKVPKETRIPAGRYRATLRRFGGFHNRYERKFRFFHKGMLELAEKTEFNNLLDVDATCDDMRKAFLQIVNPESSSSETRSIEHAFTRIIDPDFIEGEAYAAALGEETPTSIILPLLKRVAIEKVFVPNHRHYVQAIWARLSPDQRAEFLTEFIAK